MMANYRFDLAGAIKELLGSQEVAAYYGFKPNRSGFIQCPFHQGDRHGSLKLYPEQKGWHCFGCGRGGSVIDFVMELFGLSFAQAVVRINLDFGLGLCASRPTPTQTEQVSQAIQARRKAEQETQRRKDEYHCLAREHCYWWEAARVFAPTWESWEVGAIHPLYAQAVKSLDWLDYMTDELARGEEEVNGRADNAAGAAPPGRTA